MRAYKFLDADGRAPFTATPWTPGEWVESARPCREGVHTCRRSNVAGWLAATMWEVELDGQIVESRHKLIASRGRILGPVNAMRRPPAGARTAAERFADAVSLDELATCGEVVGIGVDESTFAGVAAGLAADAAYFALHGDRAQSPFVAACSAGHDAAGPDGGQAAYDTGYAAERTFHSAWLANAPVSPDPSRRATRRNDRHRRRTGWRAVHRMPPERRPPCPPCPPLLA